MSDPRSQVDAAIGKALSIALPELEAVDRDAALTSDIGLDSVQIMNLVMEIEDELDVSVPVDVLAEVQTLNQLAERLTQIKESGAS
ncbi:MAG: acyl carrier protein [Wenzhouxiangella sp.]